MIVDGKIPRPLLRLPDGVLATFISNWRRQGFTWEMVVDGPCMEPALKPGDVLHVAAETAPTTAGDIIVVRHRGRLCAHRVVRIDVDHGVRVFSTKGDRNSDIDRPRTGEHMVLGRVVAVRRPGDGGPTGGEPPPA
jgi:signal peptidase I